MLCYSRGYISYINCLQQLSQTEQTNQTGLVFTKLSQHEGDKKEEKNLETQVSVSGKPLLAAM